MDQSLLAEIASFKKSLSTRYLTPYGFFYAPFDNERAQDCSYAARKLASYKPSLILLVGIGGSNLGALAVIQALKGVFYNEGTSPRFYCADTIDNDSAEMLLYKVTQELIKGRAVFLCIVTKSGSTLETVINGSLFYELLKQYRPSDYRNFIMYITDEGSPLSLLVDKESTLLTVPPLVGGRFSVFSAVGLFPLFLMGIDVESFLAGARKMAQYCLNEDLSANPAARTALALWHAYQAGYTIHDLFVFSPSLSLVASWYRQLIGESLGKKYSKAGDLVEVGITPTVSVGTVDLHSVAQLYLAGPRVRITTFLSLENEPSTLRIPDNLLSGNSEGLTGKPVTEVKNAILKGVMRAYTKENRPFLEASLLYRSSESLGAFMMMKMVETVFLARLFSINAFDQPAVELYKQEAKKEMKKAD